MAYLVGGSAVCAFSREIAAGVALRRAGVRPRDGAATTETATTTGEHRFERGRLTTRIADPADAISHADMVARCCGTRSHTGAVRADLVRDVRGCDARPDMGLSRAV